MNELKVGLLALSAIAAVIFMSLKITSNQSGFGEHITYRTIMNDAAGIFPKTPITVAGINAGRIKKIELSGSQALITFEIKKDLPLTKNSFLRIKTVGFLGDKYLDIYMGDPRGEVLKGNEFVPNRAGGGLDELTKDASEILGDVKAVMKSIKETVSPEGQETPLKAIVRDIQEIADNTKAITGSLRTLVAGNEGKIQKVIDNLERISNNIEYETNSDNPDALLTDVKKIGPILDDAKKAMSDVSSIIADVKKGKGTVGKLLRDEEIVDQVSETLAGVNRIVNRVNMMQTELSMFTQAGTEQSQTALNLDLNTSPERFYRFGLVSSEVGVKREKQIETSTNGGTKTTESRTEFYKNTYRFNFQLGRKWDDFALRAGIIETTGGLGVDYFLTKEGTRFTFEAFDYRKSIGPNLRLISEFHMWSVFYLRASAEDLVGKGQKQNYTVGAGLRFTDDDIGRLLAFVF